MLSIRRYDTSNVVCFLLLCFLFVNKAWTQQVFNNENSQVAFQGEHAGMSFEGEFKKWHANLLLSPIEQASITATFYLKHAKTGDFMYDTTLLEGDWFDTENNPTGEFNSTEITQNGDVYEIKGTLTLRGITNPVAFELNENDKQYTAEFFINRLDYKIGLESDPDAEWVSRDIKLTLDLNK